MGFLSALAAPAVGLMGNLVGSAVQYKGQQSANQTNMEIAREQMDFQREMVNQAQDFETSMSNTAYQRSMKDMRSAGLNPMLAYQQGGASTPIGKTAPGAAIPVQNPFAGMAAMGTNTAGTASSLMSQASGRERIRSQLENDIVYRSLSTQQQVQVYQLTEKLKAEIDKVRAETSGVEADNVQRQLIADFLSSNELAGIAKYIGVKPSMLGGIIRTFFMRK